MILENVDVQRRIQSDCASVIYVSVNCLYVCIRASRKKKKKKKKKLQTEEIKTRLLFLGNRGLQSTIEDEDETHTRHLKLMLLTFMIS